MKTFLIVLSILSLKNNLQAYASELLDITYTDDKIRNPIMIIEQSNTTCDDIANIKNDIQSLKQTITDLWGEREAARTYADKEIIELITSKSNFVDTKLLAFELAQRKRDALLDQLNVSLNELLQRPSQNPELTADNLKEFNEHMFNAINKKLELQELELANVKAQNKQYLQQLKQMNELLSQQATQFKTQIDEVHNAAAEKHESLTNQLDHLNGTLIEHFGEHANKLNEQENLLKAIKEQNVEARTQSNSKSIGYESNEQLMKSLKTLFEEVSFKNSNEGETMCEPLSIDINIVDSE